MGKVELRNEFNRKSGEILRIALNLEANLDYFIATYFVKPSRNERHYFSILSEKRTFFQETILWGLNFDKKKEIFKNICKKEKCSLKELNETIKSITFIQGTRNKIAHWHMTQFKEDEPFLTNKIGLAKESEKFRLSNEIMGRINDAHLQTVNGITNLQLECDSKSK